MRSSSEVQTRSSTVRSIQLRGRKIYGWLQLPPGIRWATLKPRAVVACVASVLLRTGSARTGGLTNPVQGRYSAVNETSIRRPGLSCTSWAKTGRHNLELIIVGTRRRKWLVLMVVNEAGWFKMRRRNSLWSETADNLSLAYQKLRY